MRNGVMRKGNKLYPSYNHVQEEKKKCIPDSPTRGELDGITAGDYNASVDLHELLNHTAKPIIGSAVGLEITAEDFIMISKVGYDGCTGQFVYKQMVSEDVELANIAVKEPLFLTFLVPLQIQSKETDETVWTKPKASSTLY